MHDVEGHTVCYLRDLLVTSAHRDPELTTFLTVWNYEELFHAQAIADVLAVHGEVAGRTRIEAHRKRLGWRDRLAPLASPVGLVGGGPGLRRGPHDMGSGERMDHAGRLRPPGGSCQSS